MNDKYIRYPEFSWTGGVLDVGLKKEDIVNKNKKQIQIGEKLIEVGQKILESNGGSVMLDIGFGPVDIKEIILNEAKMDDGEDCFILEM